MNPSPPVADRPDFIDTQYRFAAHIRNPETNPAPDGIEDRRMGIYRELFYNNIAGFQEACFPVLHSITPQEKWHGMIRDFMTRYQCHTPYFPKLSEEFLEYLKSTREPQDDDPPFMLELAHYEWVEAAVDLDDTRLEDVEHQPGGDLVDSVPVVSPLAWALSYQFPVHRITSDFQPDTAPEAATFLMVYRNRKDEVGFMELNPVTFRLLEILEEEADFTGRQALEQIAAELDHPQLEAVLHGGKQTLEQLRERDIILGVRS